MASIVSVKSLSLPDSRSSNKQYIDSIRALSASRYRGIPQKRSVESSCIGWLSCMLEKSSQRYRHTSTGSAWGEVQYL